MNKKALKYYGKNYNQYKKWCLKKNVPHYSLESQKKYFEYLMNKKKIVDITTKEE